MLRASASVILMEDLAVDIRPEFLKDECRAIHAHIQKPALAGLGLCTLGRRVVEI
jgi:hypothetical protein